MKLRDHDQIMRQVNDRHSAQIRAMHRRSIELLLPYMSNPTLWHMLTDLEKTQDAGSIELLRILTEHMQGREDYANQTGDSDA